jgi:hypothetical protein
VTVDSGSFISAAGVTGNTGTNTAGGANNVPASLIAGGILSQDTTVGGAGGNPAAGAGANGFSITGSIFGGRGGSGGTAAGAGGGGGGGGGGWIWIVASNIVGDSSNTISSRGGNGGNGFINGGNQGGAGGGGSGGVIFLMYRTLSASIVLTVAAGALGSGNTTGSTAATAGYIKKFQV